MFIHRAIPGLWPTICHTRPQFPSRRQQDTRRIILTAKLGLLARLCSACLKAQNKHVIYLEVCFGLIFSNYEFHICVYTVTTAKIRRYYLISFFFFSQKGQLSWRGQMGCCPGNNSQYLCTSLDQEEEKENKCTSWNKSLSCVFTRGEIWLCNHSWWSCWICFPAEYKDAAGLFGGWTSALIWNKLRMQPYGGVR